jgi:serine/threonine protein kinase
LPHLLGAGSLPEGVALGPGLPYLLLRWTDGQAIDPALLREDDREELALVVARDVGRALDALHTSGHAHGDVKPGNVIWSAGPPPRARLVDLGLTQPASEVGLVGATPRYLEPDWSDAADDARARDLFALGVSLSEIASPVVAAADLPAEAARAVRFPPRVGRLVEALLDRTPRARPPAAWVHDMARAALGEEESAEERSARHEESVKRAYLATRRRDFTLPLDGVRVTVRVPGGPGE